MQNLVRTPAWVFLALSLFVSLPAVVGCGSNQTMLSHPDNLSDGHGVALGRVHVFKGKSDVTKKCYLEFQNAEEKGTGVYNLGEDGWVFASLPQGHNELFFVRCAVFNGLFYRTDAFQFDVPAPTKSTYFGHIEFHLANNDLKIAFGAVGGVVGHVGQAVIRDGDNAIVLSNQAQAAEAEYEKRFSAKTDMTISPGIQATIDAQLTSSSRAGL